jgi:sterol desaturase/sphingolipid hydroxylase (fatty acid hydroxylase superfamily)
VRRFFSEWPAYKYLTRHHYLHHLHPDKNFNVVLPLGDFVFGTVCKPTAAEIAEMHRQGMYTNSQALPQVEERVLEGAGK